MPKKAELPTSSIPTGPFSVVTFRTEKPLISTTATPRSRHWIPVVIPHIMQLEKKHCGGNTIYDGIGWYRRYFKLPANAKDKRIALSFEGVMTNCEIFVNGQKVTNHHGGYVGVTVDITPYVLPENNVLAVKVSAEYDPFTPPGKPQQNLDFYYYSGIYRDVRLVVTDKLHFTDELEEDEVAGGGVFVTYPQVSTQKAVVHVKAQICNDHSYPVSATFYARLKVPKNSQHGTNGNPPGAARQDVRRN